MIKDEILKILDLDLNFPSNMKDTTDDTSLHYMVRWSREVSNRYSLGAFSECISRRCQMV